LSAETEDSSVTDGREALRLCLDVNVLTADFLSRRKSGSLGSSSRILQMIADRRCALGTIQLVVSWRMLTTLQVILRRDFALGPAEAEAVADALAAFAEAGPDPTPPALILGGSGARRGRRPPAYPRHRRLRTGAQVAPENEAAPDRTKAPGRSHPAVRTVTSGPPDRHPAGRDRLVARTDSGTRRPDGLSPRRSHRNQTSWPSLKAARLPETRLSR
jgi:hypothetical protein